MRIARRHVALACAVAAFAAVRVFMPPEVRVIDGDTFAMGSERIRVENIDTAELHSDCAAERRLAIAATVRASELLQGNLSLDRFGHDRYGRTLARVTLADGRDYGETMIADGLAHRWGETRPWC